MEFKDFKSASGLILPSDVVKMEAEVVVLTAKIEKIAIRLLAIYTRHDWEFCDKEDEMKNMLIKRLDRIFHTDLLDSICLEKMELNQTAKVNLDRTQLSAMFISAYEALTEKIPPLYPETYPNVNPVYLERVKAR